MIDLHYWPTPNGHKITMFLEEVGLPYRIVPVNIGAGDQFKPEFLAISPNNRMPAIVDHEPADGAGPLSVFESGAILLYLAEKTGQLLPADLRGRLGLSWTRRDQRTFDRLAALSRRAGPVVRGPLAEFGPNYVRWRRAALARGDVASRTPEPAAAA